MAKTKVLFAVLFLASFFLTVKYIDDGATFTSLKWGATLDMAQARGK